MPTYQRNTVHTVDDIRAIADHAGSFFFSPGAMRAFQSRILSGVYAPDGFEAKEGNRFFFVTSERDGDYEPRHYKVRYAILGSKRDDRPAIDIGTVGDYPYHASAAAARKAAQAESDAIRYAE